MWFFVKKKYAYDSRGTLKMYEIHFLDDFLFFIHGKSLCERAVR